MPAERESLKAHMNQIEAKLRNNTNLTDELRADLFDMHMGNHEAIQNTLLRAIAMMAQMSPEHLELLETHPTILKLVLEGKNHANEK